MQSLEINLIKEIRSIVQSLGNPLSAITPSIYDTSVYISHLSDLDRMEIAHAWLLDQQEADGSWGEARLPIAKIAPTLSTLIYLSSLKSPDLAIQQAIQGGVEFMNNHSDIQIENADNLPVASELIIPKLIEEAVVLDLIHPNTNYHNLVSLGSKKLSHLTYAQAYPNTPESHSWEVWGGVPDIGFVDQQGSVGHSPSATSVWFSRALNLVSRSQLVRVQTYLNRAEAATSKGEKGIVPTIWPINRFEQSFALYMLYLAGLFEHPALVSDVKMQLIDLKENLTSTGIGLSDHFASDGDDTAVALVILNAVNIDVDFALLDHFICGDHFCAYPGELQSSLSVNAHALHAQFIRGGDVNNHAIDYLLRAQLSDGRWDGDKWNISWIYVTTQIIIALYNYGFLAEIEKAIEVTLAHQQTNGGWGMQKPTAEETAYVILAFKYLYRMGYRKPQIKKALKKAKNWLINRCLFNNTECTEKLWLGKELYRPIRISRILVLSALLISIIEDKQG